MPFELLNAPVSFQNYISKMLVKKLNIFIIMYLYDIFIYTENPRKSHMEAVWWVLNFLKKNGSFANLKKCWFHKDEVQFLGYVVSSQSIRIKDKKIEIVKNWLEPKSV